MHQSNGRMHNTVYIMNKNKHIPTTLNIIMSDGEHSDGCYRRAVHNCIKMIATKGEECSVQRHQDFIDHRMHVN